MAEPDSTASHSSTAVTGGGAVIIPFPRPALDLGTADLAFRPRVPWLRLVLLALLVCALAGLALVSAPENARGGEPALHGVVGT